jgi:hypothetical protein
MFRMQRLIALVGLLFPLAVQAAGGQTLGSPVAVLDALKQSRGGVLLAFIDSPSDQANPVKNLQGLLSRYRLDLNGTDLGQVRRNTILHVRPRLGVNRLTIENTFDDQQRKQLSFPAMRAAGVPTAIVEIRTSRDFAWMEALTLSADEVQAVENALNRSQTGGMPRVLALIRSRGQEAYNSHAHCGTGVEGCLPVVTRVRALLPMARIVSCTYPTLILWGCDSRYCRARHYGIGFFRRDRRRYVERNGGHGFRSQCVG